MVLAYAYGAGINIEIYSSGINAGPDLEGGTGFENETWIPFITRD